MKRISVNRLRPILKYKGPPAIKNLSLEPEVPLTETAKKLKKKLNLVDGEQSEDEDWNTPKKFTNSNESQTRQKRRNKRGYKFSSNKKFKIKQIRPLRPSTQTMKKIKKKNKHFLSKFQKFFSIFQFFKICQKKKNFKFFFTEKN